MKTILHLMLKGCLLIILSLTFSLSSEAQKVVEVYPKAIKAGETQVYYRWPGDRDVIASFYSNTTNETSAYAFTLQSRLYSVDGIGTYYQGFFPKTVSLDNSSEQSLEPGPVTMTIADGASQNWLPVSFTLLPDSAAATFNRTNIQENWSGGRLSEMNMVDLDGDGYEDILAYAYEPNRILWRKNNGNKSWSSIKTIDSWSGSFLEVRDIVAGDIDADGDNDILIAYKEFVSVYKNNGSGTFGSRINYEVPNFYVNYPTFGSISVQHIDLQDLNRDGLLDVLYNSLESNGGSSYYRKIAYRPMQSNGSFGAEVVLFIEQTTSSPNNNYKGISAGGEDRYKLVIPTPAPNYGIILDKPQNGQAGAPSAGVIYPSASEQNYRGSFLTDWDTDGVLEATDFKHTIDIDADGDLDAIEVSSFDGKIYYRENLSGNGATLSNVLIAEKANCNSCSGTSYIDVGLTDYDHDGDMDLVAINQRGFYVFENIWKGNTLYSVSNSVFTGKQSFAGNTFSYEVDSTTDLTSVNLEYHLSGGATGQASSTDFSNPVTYTVTSEEGVAEAWSIQLIPQPTRPISTLKGFFEVDSLNIDWVDIPGAITYEVNLQIKNTAGSFTSVAGYPKTITTSGIGIKGFSANTDYQLIISATNTFSTVSYPETVSFTTPPDAPNITNTTVECGDQLQIAWQTVSGASGYRLEIATDAAFNQIVVDSVLSGLQWSGNLEAGLSYHMRLYSIGSRFESASSGPKVFSSPPAVPTGILLSQFTASSVLVSWDNIPSAEGYRVYVYLGTGTLEAQSPTLTEDTSFEITGLTSGTEYTLRLKSIISGSGLCSESKTSEGVTFTTVPSAPSNLSATVTTSSADMTWSETRGATSYQVQVSESDAFNVLLMDSILQETQVRILDLFESWNYFFRVRAINESGISVFSTRDFTTQGDPNTAPTGMDLSSLNINENLPAGTLVASISTADANTTDSFTYSLVSDATAGGEDNSSFTISNDQLIANQVFNFENKSTYSVKIQTSDRGGLTYRKVFVITVVNVNDAPTNLSLSNNETVAYSAIGTTIGTLSASDEDAGDSQTYSIDTGGDAFEIDGNTLKNSVIFTNEEDSTVALTLRATDSKGAFTTAFQEILIQKFIDLDLPVISSLSDPKDFANGSAPITLSVEVSDFRISTVTFKTRALTSEDFETTDVSTQTSPYTITVSEADFDGVGMEFYVTATDASGNIAESEKRKISLSFSEASSPAIESITRFGGKVEDYEIISIPFVFEGTGNRVQEIFNEYNGGIPDKTIWRLIKYNPSATPDVSGLEDLVASSPVKIGEGYFFNAKEAAEVKIGSAQVNTTDPQEIVLRPGWNLIGNPYAVDINWSAVLTRNGIPEVGPLRVLDPNDPARWPESTQLEKFKGAFVNLMSESNKTITITYADKTPTGGRTSTIERPDYDWYLPLTLEQGDNQGSGSIGMHQQAKVGVDQFDALTLPRWLRYLEITFDHPEYAFSSFSKDIVSVADSYSWEFEVSSDQAGLSKLHWGDAFGNISNLKLLDVAEDRVIDMLSQPGYAFDLQGKKSFKIFFSQDPDDLFTSERISIGDAYPNPFEKQVNIPISLPEHDEDFNVKLEVIDLTGRVFWQVEDQMPSGLYEFTMERPAVMTSGLYLYRLTVLSKGVELEFTKKFVVE